MACEDREAETLKLAEFEAMGKAMSEELAVCYKDTVSAGVDWQLSRWQWGRD